MSHYRMAVLQTPTSPDLEDLMAPYSEHIRVEPYVVMTRSEALAEARKAIDEAKARIAEGHTDEWTQAQAAHDGEKEEDILLWYSEWCGYGVDDDASFTSTYNPKSKWDYYGEIETLTFDEWLRSGTDMTDEELRREWKVLSTRGDGWYGKQYYNETYGDEDFFVKSCHIPTGWGVVTPDGEWHEPGRVGWFATDDSTQESRRDWVEHFHERFVEPYDPKTTTVVIVDCHI